LDRASPIPEGAGDAALLERLRESALAAGLSLRDSRAAIADTTPPDPAWLRDLPAEERAQAEERARRSHTLLLSVQFHDGIWLTARMVTPRPNPWAIVRPLVATLLTYLIILAAMIWIARRLGRPLRDLAGAAERFHGRGEAPRVEPRGPLDLNRAILAFNAMSARVSAMLDEKDRMLGAIGHDLRTPLASLRIRAETVEPEEDRAAMIATIEEMSAMLDDTLALARSGRAVETLRMVDIAALADTVVEEHRALGHDVTLEDGASGSARVQSRLLTRAIRNLVANAVIYAGAARVAVRSEGEELLIEISDRGPGIAENELKRVLEPFYRVEPSRSRETGGSGLGLTLARAAAQAHGGDLDLENRPGGGLIARLRLRRDPPETQA
jgi:signal transduction histidine kinase